MTEVSGIVTLGTGACSTTARRNDTWTDNDDSDDAGYDDVDVFATSDHRSPRCDECSSTMTASSLPRAASRPRFSAVPTSALSLSAPSAASTHASDSGLVGETASHSDTRSSPEPQSKLVSSSSASTSSTVSSSAEAKSFQRRRRKATWALAVATFQQAFLLGSSVVVGSLLPSQFQSQSPSQQQHAPLSSYNG